jgi:hypothetical protein
MSTSARLSAIHDSALRRRWITSRIVFGVGLIFLIVLSTGIFMTGYIEMNLQGFARALIPIGEDAPAWAYPLLAYVGYFVLPAILILPVLPPESMRWRDPRRIVVFRRFNVKDRNRAVRPRLHAFRSADPPLVVCPHPGPLGSTEPSAFSDAYHHQRAAPRDAQTRTRPAVRLNLNWLVSLRKIFPVRSSDEYWKVCMQTLLEHADLVVMEISEVSEAVSWELHECECRLLSKSEIKMSGNRRWYSLPRGTASQQCSSRSSLLEN